MDDIFHEIEDDLRQEKLVKFWKAYGTYAIGLVIALIVGTASYTYWKHHKGQVQIALSQEYSKALEQIDSGMTDEAIKTLEIIKSESGNVYSALAQLKIAAVKSQSRDTKSVADAYEALAADKKADSIFRDAAQLMKEVAILDTAEPTTLVQALVEQSQKGTNPWRLNAKELLAWAKWREGKTAEAQVFFAELANTGYAWIKERSRVMSTFQK